MLIDHRTYRIKPGQMARHLATYEEHGFKTQLKHLGDPLCYLVAESGDLNTIVHAWTYQNAGDREARRAAMNADPAWKNYLRLNAEAGILESQITRLMVPVPFVPLKR